MIIDNFSVEALFLTIVVLIVLWIVVSIPVWIASKAVTAGKTSFGEASIATLAGPIVYVSVTFSIDLLLGGVMGSVAFILGYILALITWIFTFKDDFRTGWLHAIFIAFIAWVVFLTLSILIGFAFGIAYSNPFFPQIVV